MKICKDCGQLEFDNVNFCTNCGCSEFSSSSISDDQGPQKDTYQQQYSQQNTYQAPPQYQQPSDVQYQAPYMSQKKKGLRWWHILLIVLGALIVLFFVIGIIANSSDDDSSDDFGGSTSYSSSESGSSKKKEEKVKYTKGEIKDNYYINEWADLKFEITDDFPDTPDLYSNYEDNKTESGFVSANLATGKQFIISFEDTKVSFSETTYLEACKKNLEKMLDDKNDSAEFEKISDIKIAGKQFKVLRYTVKSNNLKAYICVRMIDNRAVVISMTSFDEADFNNALSLISELD